MVACAAFGACHSLSTHRSHRAALCVAHILRQWRVDHNDEVAWVSICLEYTVSSRCSVKRAFVVHLLARNSAVLVYIHMLHISAAVRNMSRARKGLWIGYILPVVRQAGSSSVNLMFILLDRNSWVCGSSPFISSASSAVFASTTTWLGGSVCGTVLSRWDWGVILDRHLLRQVVRWGWSSLLRQKPYDRHFWEELLRVLFCNARILIVPATTFKVHAANKCTIFRLFDF